MISPAHALIFYGWRHHARVQKARRPKPAGGGFWWALMALLLACVGLWMVSQHADHALSTHEHRMRARLDRALGGFETRLARVERKLEAMLHRPEALMVVEPKPVVEREDPIQWGRMMLAAAFLYLGVLRK